MNMDLKKMKIKFSENLKKHEDNIKRIKSFVLIIVGYGILINYALLIMFQIPFKWYGFPAFGIAYYFIMEEFTTLFRKLRSRNIQ